MLVDDQDKGLRFSTEVLGFQTRREPDEHPAAKPFMRALAFNGIPFTAIAVDDVRAEFERLRTHG